VQLAASAAPLSEANCCPSPLAPQVIPSNFQIRGMHTIIRDASTSTPDFVFYSDRLLRLVRARALQCWRPQCYASCLPVSSTAASAHAVRRCASARIVCLPISLC
jgi:uracil phosphoribosyltransferase